MILCTQIFIHLPHSSAFYYDAVAVQHISKTIPVNYLF